MEFKSRIKQLRMEKKFTHTQLASQFGKTEAAVRAWETGRTKPDADTLIILAEYFGCTTDYLLGLSDYKNNEEKQEVKEEKDNLYETILSLPPEARETARTFLKVIDNRFYLPIFGEENVKSCVEFFEVLTGLTINFSSTNDSVTRINEVANWLQDWKELKLRQCENLYEECSLEDNEDLPLTTLLTENQLYMQAYFLLDKISIILANESSALSLLQTFFSKKKVRICEEITSNKIFDYLELPKENYKGDINALLKHLREYYNKRSGEDA